MDSEFLRVAKNRRSYPEAANVILLLKKSAISWDQKPDDLSDEEAFDILRKKHWISLQRISDEEDPVRDISPLADFSELTGLVLSNNEIVSVSALKNLTKLKRLVMSRNKLKDLGPLRAMSCLAQLEIQHNPIHDFSILADLPALRELEISSEQLSAFASVDSLNALWKLRIYEPCENLRALPALPNLRVLQVDCASLDGVERFAELRNLDVTGGALRDLSPIAGLAKVTHLGIGHNQVESLEPLRRLFALRDLWAGNNRIRSIKPLSNLPVLHAAVLKENPIPPHELERLQQAFPPWDDEFADSNPQIQPARDIEIVDQKTWDYYDTHPFNASDFDGNEGMLDSEKLWLMKQIETALNVDWEEDTDFTIPFQSPRARSLTICLYSEAAIESFRSIATIIQHALCRARNEFIVYLQTDAYEDDIPKYIVWIYRNRIMATPETAPTVTALLSQ